MLAGPGGNVVVLHGPDGKIVVDGFVKPAWPRLKAALDAIDGSPIKSVIDTHWHFDHADNNGNFSAAGAGVIAHENTRTRLMQPHDLLGMHFDPVASSELPTQTFAAGLTLNANGEQTDLRKVAPAHTDTDIFVFFPKANVLHMGDVFFNGFYPFIDASTGGTIDGMIEGVQAALKIVTAQTQDRPRPRSARRPGRAGCVRREVLTTVRDRVRTAKAAGKSLADVQAAKPSAEFDATWGKGDAGAERLRRARLQHGAMMMRRTHPRDGPRVAAPGPGGAPARRVRPARNRDVREFVRRRGAVRVRARHGAAALVRVRSSDRRLPGGRGEGSLLRDRLLGHRRWRSGATRSPPASSRRRCWRRDANSPARPRRRARRPRASATTWPRPPRSTTSRDGRSARADAGLSRRDGQGRVHLSRRPGGVDVLRAVARGLRRTRPTRPTRTS